MLLRLLSVAAVGFIFAATAHAAEPLVDGNWAVQNVAAQNVVFIDVQSTRNYQRRHIPGSIHTDYPDDGWRFFAEELGVVLPSRAEFARLVGSLGVANESHVVLVATGGSERDMSIATDVYWTFKYFGHAEVSVLDGGLRAYRSARGKVEKGAGANRQANEYSSRRRARYLAEYDDVFGVVSMRAIAAKDADRTRQITAKYPHAHGAPLNIDDPSELGIDDIESPDWGEPQDLQADEVAMFWACGVTSHSALLNARLSTAITHAPGAMLITDLPADRPPSR